MTATAYSYTRFSTKEQAEGTSKRRQDALVAAWRKANPRYKLSDQTFHDAGVSASKGANRKKGALGKFLKAVEHGKVERGSALLVENWDRFTREAPYDAEPTLRAIFSAGITIVNLEEDEAFDEATVRDDYKKFRSILDDIDRAHRQAERLGRQISAMWETKRQEWANWRPGEPRPKPFTTRGPDWVNWEDGDWQLVGHQVAAVRQIFEWKAEGVGGETIMQRLNGNPAWRRPKDWYRGYIERVVRNREVLGEFTPTKDGKKGKPIPEYFPAIIDLDLWNRALGTTAQNSELAGNGGGVKGAFNNLFRGIAKCGRCGSAMRFLNKGPAPRRGHSHYLKCSDARRGLGCDGTLVPYDRLEDLLLRLCRALPVAELLTDTKAQDSIKLQCQSIRGALAEINKRRETLMKLKGLVETEESFKNLAAELDAIAKRKDELQHQLDSLESKQVHTPEAAARHLQKINALIALREQLKAEGRLTELGELNGRIHHELKSLMDSIKITPSRRQTKVEVTFKSGARLYLEIEKGVPRLVLDNSDGRSMIYHLDEDGTLVDVDEAMDETTARERYARGVRTNHKVAEALARKRGNLSQIGG